MASDCGPCSDSAAIDSRDVLDVERRGRRRSLPASAGSAPRRSCETPCRRAAPRCRRREPCRRRRTRAYRAPGRPRRAARCASPRGRGAARRRGRAPGICRAARRRTAPPPRGCSGTRARAKARRSLRRRSPPSAARNGLRKAPRCADGKGWSSATWRYTATTGARRCARRSSERARGDSVKEACRHGRRWTNAGVQQCACRRPYDHTPKYRRPAAR